MIKTRGKNFKETTKSLFLKYAIIPNLLLIILFSIFTILLLNIKTIYDTKKSASNIEKKVENVYENYKKEMERMLELPELYKTIETTSLNHLIYEEFYNFNNQIDVKSVFHLIDKRNVFLVSTAHSNGELNQKIIEDIIPFIERNPNDIYLNVERTEHTNGQVTVLNLATAVQVDEEIVGYIVYQLFEDDFQELIFDEKSDIVVITDYFDYIVATTSSITSGLMNKFHPKKISKSQIELKDNKYYFKELRTSDNRFAIYTMNNVKNDKFIYFLFFLFIIIVGVVTYILLNNMAEKMSTKNGESIEKLMNAVSKLEKGNMEAHVNIDSGDEFEVLANEFNNMLDNLNILMQRNAELANIRQQKEIKLLESQFNPHFLFNVLETLKYTMLIDIDKAQEIIFSLGRVLRYSLDDSLQEVLFQKDLNYIIDYLKLHTHRFGDRLQYKIDVDKEVIKASVPKLLLQPIIENAIKYGYEKQTHLSIRIDGRLIEDKIIFKVIDNGKGISKDKLKGIKETIYSGKRVTGGIGIGLYNTHRRVVLQYGDRYGLTINSTVDSGTEVMIELPYKKGD